jgi:phosphoglycolate phosphatase-like HAD superfamily hydrolase
MPLDIARVRAICFDVDGTLSDTDDQAVDRLARVLDPLMFVFPGRGARHLARRLVMAAETPGNLVYNLADRFGVDGVLNALVRHLGRLQPGQKPSPFLLIPKVDVMLARLYGRFPLAVVSARDEEGTRAFLSQFNLERYFQCVVSAQTCRFTKPYPDPVLYAAARLGVPPAECLMVGDTTLDVRAGKAAGAQTVGVLCGFGERRELERAGADLILESTSLLADLF